MDDEEEGGTGAILGIVIAALVVVTLVVIVIPAINTSGGGIIASLKEKLGFDKKAEASTAKSDECRINRYYWSKDKVKIGEHVDVIVESTIGCNGKSVNVDIFEDLILGQSKLLKSAGATFKDSKAAISWATNEKGRYYFAFN